MRRPDTDTNPADAGFDPAPDRVGDPPPDPAPDSTADSAADPVRVALRNDYQLVIAGVAGILAPFAERVVVVDPDPGPGTETGAGHGVDVVLYDSFARTQDAPAPEDAVPRSGPDPGPGREPQAPLVVYTWRTDAGAVAAARHWGAHGLVSKSADTAVLVDTLERVRDGQLVFPAVDLDEVLTRGGRWPGQEHQLSARESEVLALICQGLSNHEIATRAYLGINTVKTYIRSAYRKVGVTTRSQAVIWGLSHGFEPDPVAGRRWDS